MFWKSLFRPFILCWEHKSRSFLWIIYIIIGGLLGVAINLINRWICGGMSFQEAVYVESVCGTFYTFSIVLTSAAIGPLFFNLVESKILHFSAIKSFTITISFFVMVFCAVFYSNLEDKVSAHLSYVKENGFSLHWSQLIFFALGILLALYCFGIEYLDKDPEHNKDIDWNTEYAKEENDEVDGLKTANPTTDGDGTRL